MHSAFFLDDRCGILACADKRLDVVAFGQRPRIGYPEFVLVLLNDGGMSPHAVVETLDVDADIHGAMRYVLHASARVFVGCSHDCRGARICDCRIAHEVAEGEVGEDGNIHDHLHGFWPQVVNVDDERYILFASEGSGGGGDVVGRDLAPDEIVVRAIAPEIGV